MLSGVLYGTGMGLLCAEVCLRVHPGMLRLIKIASTVHCKYSEAFSSQRLITMVDHPKTGLKKMRT